MTKKKQQHSRNLEPTGLFFFFFDFKGVLNYVHPMKNLKKTTRLQLYPCA